MSCDWWVCGLRAQELNLGTSTGVKWKGLWCAICAGWKRNEVTCLGNSMRAQVSCLAPVRAVISIVSLGPGG